MEWPGVEHAWDQLDRIDPADVQTRTGVRFDRDQMVYRLTCLGQDITVSVSKRTVISTSDTGKYILSALGEYSRLPILSYLVHAKDIPLTGRLMRPSDLSGGDIFARGTHVLPLDRVHERFGNDSEAFLETCLRLGGTRLSYGDVSVMLYPLPRIPTVIIVWSGDDEHPPRCSLLFDSSCSFHLSTDVLWATAMMSVKMMLFRETEN